MVDFLNKFKIFFVTSIFLIGANCFSQTGIPFHRISTAQGLSQSTVFCTFQDSMGYLWFGTSEGLNRYDGYTFKIFRHILNDPNSLRSNDIYSIGEDALGNIWVGTRTRGISILNKTTLKFDNSINQTHNIMIGDAGISKIIKDKNNNIWFSATSKGIYKFDFLTQKVIKISSRGVNDKNISNGFCDKDGNIWFGNSDLEIIKYINGKFEKKAKLTNDNISPNTYVSGFLRAKSGLIYITTSTNGLFTYDQQSNVVKSILYNKKVLDGENNMKGIVASLENTIYIPTNDGLIIIPDEKIENLVHQKANSSRRYELSTHALMSILIDKNQNIWIGTWEGGINVFYKKQPTFSLLRHEPGLINGPLERKITSVAANNNEIWLGTNIGLSLFNRKEKSWKHYTEPQIAGKDINSLKFDNEGDLFISAYQKALTVFFEKAKTFKIFELPNNTLGNSLSTFAMHPSGKMWIGTKNNGIFLFDKKTGQYEDFSIKFPALNWKIPISALMHDNKNRLWVGTSTNGLYRIDFETNSFVVFKNGKNSQNLSDDHILALQQDKSGKIWVGTDGGGLNRYNDNTNIFSTISEQDGLPNNTIKSIIEDKIGNIWVSTNQGICNYNPIKSTFRSFNEQDGLQGKEFGRGVRSINENGELFFGGSNGLTFFHPSNLNSAIKNGPKIIFSDLKLFNKSVDIGAKGSPLVKPLNQTSVLTLLYKQSSFSIEYLALDFQLLKNYQYSYKLAGFDTDWNTVGTQRSASYTNIPEGDYIFMVKSTNNEGVWTQNISKIIIKILPPWYRTIWAYFAYIFLLLMSLYFWRRIIEVRERLRSDNRVQRIEAKKIKELDIAKTNFFTNISHEFRTPLTLIISPIQQLLQSNSYQTEALNKQHFVVLKNAQRLQRLINQILDISKLEAGSMKLEVSKNDIVEFLNSIALSFKVLADNKNINFIIDLKNTSRYCFFDRDILEKITYNLLSNAFKFTLAKGEIRIKSEIQNQFLYLEIEDNGVGMDDETTNHIFERYYQADGERHSKRIGTGIGLALTKELIELHKGTIDVESILGQGSKFVVQIPISANKYDIIQIKENFDFESEIMPNYFHTAKMPNTEILLENDASIILIVEDNDELREYLAGLFDIKYKILVAPDGKKGYELAIQNLPDIILSDYIMPIMNGAEFCKAIKTDEKTSHIPFVMLSSRQNDEVIHHTYDLGADDYIIKPFNVGILTKKVENIIKSRILLRQKFGAGKVPILENIFQNETEEKFFKKANGIIEANIENPDFDVSELENKLNMSKMQLYRKLKAVSNLAPNEFIRNIRLTKAKSIMNSTNLNVSEIAYSVGFNDPAYFTRCFKKEFGISPTDFMNRIVS